MREDEGVTRHIFQLGKNSTEYKFDKFETFSEVKIAQRAYLRMSRCCGERRHIEDIIAQDGYMHDK